MQYETVLVNGRIIDGSGNPWFRGEIGIQAGKITAIAPDGSLRGDNLIDVAGRFITPGFIDIHTHSDLSLLINRRAESAVRQGATTHVIGNCGMSPAPLVPEHFNQLRSLLDVEAHQPEITWHWQNFTQYLEALNTGGLAINVASLAGHGALRVAVMGLEAHPPSPTEMEMMKSLLHESMQAGVFGLSTGLVYPPGCFASTNEIVELCHVIAEYGGFYASHIRGERETILEAVTEAISIGEQSGVPVQISHNAPKFGAPCRADANLRLVEEARQRGQDVTVDNDVHTDLAPALTDCLPQELHSLPVDELTRLLREPTSRSRIRQQIVSDVRPAFGPSGLLKHGQWHRITLLHAPHNPLYLGKTIQALADQQAHDPFDVYFDLILQNYGQAVAIFDYIDDENIRLLLQHPAVMICSDGQAVAPSTALNDLPPYSPCSYGEFPGVLERYVRDYPILRLEEAIRKMTSFPAQRLGLRDRGSLHLGAWADLVVFDLERIHDRATNLFPHTYPFENYPHQYPQGIDWVFVNGVCVVENGEHTGALPGRVLRHI